MLPALAVQLVALFDENCCVAPRFTLTFVGEIVVAGGGPAAVNVRLKTGPHSVPGF